MTIAISLVILFVNKSEQYIAPLTNEHNNRIIFIRISYI